MFRNQPQIVTCARCRPLLSHALDGATLPEAARRHLESCTECVAFGRDLHTVKAGLHALPRLATSPEFDAALLARLSQLSPRPVWTLRRRILRPVLAFGACAALAGAAFFVHPVSVATPPSLAVAVPVDPALVGHCVAQHRADMAVQPLSDPAAQTLSERLASASTDAAYGSGL